MNAKNNKMVHVFIIGIILILMFFASEKIAFILDVFQPVFMGIVFAYLLDGMVRFFTRKCKMKRGFAIFFVLVLVFAIGALSVYIALPFLIDTTKDLITYISDFFGDSNNSVHHLISRIAFALKVDISSINVDAMDSAIVDFVNNIAQKLSTLLVNGIMTLGSSLLNIITSVMLAIYMLIEKDNLIKWIKRFVRGVFSESKGEYILDAFSMANKVFKKFIIGKFIDSTIIGILCFILFSIFKIEYAAVFSIITGVGNMIPYFGPIFFAIPVVGILLIINPQNAIVAAIIILIVQQLDGNVIGPKVLGDNVGVSAFWILFAVTVCGMAFGFVGMVVGVPLVVSIKNLVEDYVEKRLKERENNLSEQKTEVVVQNAEEQ